MAFSKPDILKYLHTSKDVLKPDVLQLDLLKTGRFVDWMFRTI
jgi:hypothetical protein